ncbi:hypothetical protein [Bradyrhizobium mercantei]|uniref:hypothetical protein n=1 Tax=Bradyrhizobium mercantei TaxID=1904807 RepID=UPI0009759E76|nr:hypothetical protein [Bradyrhizobium mercantei]
MFGRRKTPGDSAFPLPPVDSDGKRRVFGEDVFAGRHGAMLQALGFSLNDAANIIPDQAEDERRIKQSLATQDARRTEIETEMLRAHGHNAIRPFFVLSGPVWNGELGQWLVKVMHLLPYDDWNIVYLPMDRATQAAMGGLPLHPQQSIDPIDELMCKQIGGFYSQFKEGKQKVDAHVREVGISAAHDMLDKFVTYVDQMPRQILDHIAIVRPKIIELIADVQSRA